MPEPKPLNESRWQTILQQNPLTSQLIGLSPLLAISHSVALGLLMSLIMAVTLSLTSSLVSISRFIIPPAIALPCYVVFSATIVTVIDLLMQAHLPEARQALGLYLPIVAANCLILDRSQLFAARNPLFSCLKDSLHYSLIIIVVLVLLSVVREFIAYGSVLRDLDLLIGKESQQAMLQLLPTDQGLSLIATPAGGFIVFGFLIACLNFLSIKLKKSAPVDRT